MPLASEITIPESPVASPDKSKIIMVPQGPIVSPVNEKPNVLLGSDTPPAVIEKPASVASPSVSE